MSFPSSFTALSTLLELRAADAVTGATGTVTLPVSGAVVTIEAWKLTGSSVDLAAQIANLKTWLAENETSTGHYLHGSRFVAFFNVGGMEYDGGTTCSPGSLRHETFHSWWGRGVKPAGQADGWWDEAWNVYHDLGFSGSLPFDFTDPPVELSSRNPWIRVTPSGAYSSGERFFEGLASMVGVADLKAHLRAFYGQHQSRPTTTADMEALLVCRSGEPRVVDAFHRFVYGFPDPSPAPDLWIKDDPGDPGGNLWAGRFWDSPDLWIRYADDGGTAHQPVEHGQDNWFYARVRNRSTTATASTSSPRSTSRPSPASSSSIRVTSCPASQQSPASSSAPANRRSSKRAGRLRSFPCRDACLLAGVGADTIRRAGLRTARVGALKSRPEEPRRRRPRR